LKLKLSSESTVRLLTWAPPMSSVTVDAPCPLALLLSMSAFVLLVGPPFDHLEALLQFPDAPPTQHVPPEGQVNVSGPAAAAKGLDKRDAAGRPNLRCALEE